MHEKESREITFLGTGTSHGVPVIGCRCEVCLSTDPRDKRLRSSLLYSEGNKTLIIDCGPDFRQQYLRWGRGEVAGVLLTHIHYDHTGGLDDLRSLSYKNGLDVFASADVIKQLKKKNPYFFHTNYVGTPNLRFHSVMPYLPFTVSGIEIEPLAIMHGSMLILGYKIGDFAYITDASTVPGATMGRLKGVNTLVVNALRHKEHFAHMNIQQALSVIQITGVKKAYLTHLSHEAGLHTALNAMLPENVEPGHDGWNITLDN